SRTGRCGWITSFLGKLQDLERRRRPVGHTVQLELDPVPNVDRTWGQPLRWFMLLSFERPDVRDPDVRLLFADLENCTIMPTKRRPPQRGGANGYHRADRRKRSVLRNTVKIG